MNFIDIKAATAFAGCLDNIENSEAELAGYSGTENHPMLPVKVPGYRISREHMNVLTYVWQREMLRLDSDPRRGVWFGGPKGCGKTTLVEQFFTRLGVPVVSITCNRKIPLSDLISKMVPDGEGGWMEVPGVLAIAMEEGYPVVFNEPSKMDPADLVAMHDIIDRGLLVKDDGTVLRAARGFLVFATDNTMGHGDFTGAYAGANTMDQATMSRFLKCEVDYPSPKEELLILKRRNPDAHEDVLEKLVDFANAIREPVRKGNATVTMGTRELIDFAECALYFSGSSVDQPVWFAFERVMGGMPDVEFEAAKAVFQSILGGNPGGAGQ